MESKKRGLLIIISGPSGVGKGTIVRKLLKSDKKFVASVSVTTRKPRWGEKNGIHYHFISKENFLDMVNKNGFLEYARYNSNYYGTPSDIVYKVLDEGKNVILEIDVQGAFKVKSKHKDAIMIFVMPPCINDLYYRLKSRNTENFYDIQKRIKTAKEEIEVSKKYDYVIVNDSVSRAVKEINEILKKR